MRTDSSSKTVRSPHRTETSRELESFKEIQGLVHKEILLLTDRVAKDIFERFFGKFSHKEMPESTGELICRELIQPSVNTLVFLVTKDSGRRLFKTNFSFLFSDTSPGDLRAAANAVDQLLQRIQKQYESHQSLLPQEEKCAIENQTYGKQPRAAEMSDKIREAIAKGEHPGAFIQRELIRPSGLKLEFIAEKIGVHAVTLSSLQNSRRSLSPELAAKLSSYFHTYSTLDLLTIQAGHDARKADQELIGLPEEKNPTPV
jgi:addiction module HigA family antidote